MKETNFEERSSHYLEDLDIPLPKILIVDDKEENIFALKQTLEKCKAEFFEATSGNEALALTLTHDFALVLMDVQMPEIDGIEAAVLMRSKEATRQVPIIFVTAINKDEKYVFKGYQSGAVDYLFKPIDNHILVSKVNVFLNLHSQKSKLRQQKMTLEKLLTELDESQEELKRSNKDLNDFTRVASHDLKAPLRHMMTFAKMIEEDYANKLDEEGQDYIDKLVESGNRMQALIDGLLDYARSTSLGSALEPVDLNKVIRSVLSDLTEEIKDQKAQVNVGEFPTINSNETQMRQLFQNLIGNAIKYIKKEKIPKINVDCHQFGQDKMKRGADQSLFKIVIEDNGIGFDEKYIEKMFTPFQRLVSQKDYQGSGLGLATVKKIVDRYGGTIQVKSQPDQGSTFTITLPLNANAQRFYKD